MRFARSVVALVVALSGLVIFAGPANATRVVWANDAKCSQHNRCVEFGVQVAEINGEMYAQASARCLDGSTPRKVMRCEYTRPKDPSVGIRVQLFENRERVAWFVPEWCGPKGTFAECPLGPFTWQTFGNATGFHDVWFANMEIKVGLYQNDSVSEFLSTAEEVWP